MEPKKFYKISDKYGNIYKVQFLGNTPKCAKIKYIRSGNIDYFEKERFYKEHKIIDEICKK